MVSVYKNVLQIVKAKVALNIFHFGQHFANLLPTHSEQRVSKFARPLIRWL